MGGIQVGSDPIIVDSRLSGLNLGTAKVTFCSARKSLTEGLFSFSDSCIVCPVESVPRSGEVRFRESLIIEMRWECGQLEMDWGYVPTCSETEWRRRLNELAIRRTFIIRRVRVSLRKWNRIWQSSIVHCYCLSSWSSERTMKWEERWGVCLEMTTFSFELLGWRFACQEWFDSSSLMASLVLAKLHAPLFCPCYMTRRALPWILDLNRWSLCNK
jgi:hypothetical protein